MNRLFRSSAHAAVAIFTTLGGCWSTALASSIYQMSFEEVTDQADVVVLGKVVSCDEYARMEPSSHTVLLDHAVLVERYLKGSGAREITVMTVGGKYRVETPKGPDVQEVTARGQPQLPSVGSEILLFLRHWGNGYMVCSASHGVVEVQTTEKGQRVVLLRFRDPAVMSESALRDYHNMHQEGGENAILISDRVPVEELQTVFARLASKAELKQGSAP